MDRAQLALVVVGAVWASASSIIAISKTLNQTRNHIVLGVMDNQPLPLNFRKLLLKNDWIPLNIAICIICVIFTTVICLIPWLIPSQDRSFLVFVVCLVAALNPFIAFLAFAIWGQSDYKYIKDVLVEAENQEGQHLA